MILRLKPSAPAIIPRGGLNCYFCGKGLVSGAIGKPMSGASWTHLECFENSEKSKNDKKLGKKALRAEAISKMSQKKQDYYNKPQDFSAKGFENEEPNLF